MSIIDDSTAAPMMTKRKFAAILLGCMGFALTLALLVFLAGYGHEGVARATWERMERMR